MPTVMIDLHGSLGSLVMSAALILAVLAFGAFLLGTRRPGRVLARVVDLAVVAAVVLIAVTMFAGGLTSSVVSDRSRSCTSRTGPLPW